MIEVLREGEPTIDGRFINFGAIRLPEDPVPLFDFDKHEGNARDQYSKVGELFNFSRGEDSRIYCESSLEDDDRTITVSISIDEKEEVGGEMIAVSGARILGGVVSSTMEYPWK